MKIIVEQYMVQSGMNDWQVLYCCIDDEYFITTTGAFKQRPMSIIQISKQEALRLLHDEQEAQGSVATKMP